MGHGARWMVSSPCKFNHGVLTRLAERVQTAAYNRQLPIVKYLIGLGVDTEAADIGTRFVAVGNASKTLN